MSLTDVMIRLEHFFLPIVPRPALFWLEALYFRRFGEAELALLPFLIDPRQDAIDVGGNVGAYSLFLRRLARQVHVFEPIPSMAALLRYKFGSSVTVYEQALSDSAGRATLRFPRSSADHATAFASLAPTALSGQTDLVEIPVETIPLDQFAFDRVGLIKIDVEGHEEAVLQGARETINRCRPRLIVEIEERHAPGALRRIVDWLTTLDYGCFYYDGALLRRFGSRPIAELQSADGPVPGRLYVRNFIFVPTEQFFRIETLMANGDDL